MALARGHAVIVSGDLPQPGTWHLGKAAPLLHGSAWFNLSWSMTGEHTFHARSVRAITAVGLCIWSAKRLRNRTTHMAAPQKRAWHEARVDNLPLSNTQIKEYLEYVADRRDIVEDASKAYTDMPPELAELMREIAGSRWTLVQHFWKHSWGCVMEFLGAAQARMLAHTLQHQGFRFDVEKIRFNDEALTDLRAPVQWRPLEHGLDGVRLPASFPAFAVDMYSFVAAYPTARQGELVASSRASHERIASHVWEIILALTGAAEDERIPLLVMSRSAASEAMLSCLEDYRLDHERDTDLDIIYDIAYWQSAPALQDVKQMQTTVSAVLILEELMCYDKSPPALNSESSDTWILPVSLNVDVQEARASESELGVGTFDPLGLSKDLLEEAKRWRLIRMRGKGSETAKVATLKASRSAPVIVLRAEGMLKVPISAKAYVSMWKLIHTEMMITALPRPAKEEKDGLGVFFDGLVSTITGSDEASHLHAFSVIDAILRKGVPRIKELCMRTWQKHARGASERLLASKAALVQATRSKQESEENKLQVGKQAANRELHAVAAVQDAIDSLDLEKFQEAMCQAKKRVPQATVHQLQRQWDLTVTYAEAQLKFAMVQSGEKDGDKEAILEDMSIISKLMPEAVLAVQAPIARYQRLLPSSKTFRAAKELRAALEEAQLLADTFASCRSVSPGMTDSGGQSKKNGAITCRLTEVSQKLADLQFALASASTKLQQGKARDKELQFEAFGHKLVAAACTLSEQRVHELETLKAFLNEINAPRWGGGRWGNGHPNVEQVSREKIGRLRTLAKQAAIDMDEEMSSRAAETLFEADEALLIQKLCRKRDAERLAAEMAKAEALHLNGLKVAHKTLEEAARAKQCLAEKMEALDREGVQWDLSWQRLKLDREAEEVKEAMLVELDNLVHGAEEKVASLLHSADCTEEVAKQTYSSCKLPPSSAQVELLKVLINGFEALDTLKHHGNPAGQDSALAHDKPMEAMESADEALQAIENALTEDPALIALQNVHEDLAQVLQEVPAIADNQEESAIEDIPEATS